MIFKHAFFATCILFATAISGANASPFSITIGAATGADGTLGFTLTGDTRNGTAFLDYDEMEQTSDLLNFISTSFVDPGAAFERSNFNSFINGMGLVSNAVDFTVSNPLLPYVVTSDSGSSESRTGYSFTFTLFQMLAPDGTVIQYEASSSQTVLGSAYSSMDAIVSVSGNPFSTVPLPASAPLFGAAVLALGAVGYGVKRKKAAAAS